MGCCKSTPIDQNQIERARQRTIYVENLPAWISASHLRLVFKRFGRIPSEKIRVINQLEQGANAYAFIEFERRSSRAKAVEASPLFMCGRQVVIREKWWSSDGAMPAPNSEESA